MKKLPSFLLDEWLNSFKNVKVDHDLATSTGPVWPLSAVLELLTPAERARMEAAAVHYAAAEGSPELREAIGKAYGASAEDVIVTTGAAEALHVVFAEAASRGGNVVVGFPGFPPGIEIPAALGLEVRRYHHRPENGFRIDLEEVAGLLDGETRLLLVTSPHNPTGTTLSKDELAALHALVASRGVPLVSDEVYGGITFDGGPASAVNLPGAIVLGSFSKAISLPGLRLGWIIDRDAARRAAFLNARMYFTISSGPLTETLAAAVLRNRERFVGATRSRARANLALLARFVEEQPRLAWVRPRGGTTSFPWLVDAEDSRPFCRALADAGVLTAPGDCFGMPRHLRVGFGSGERFAEALEVFGRVLAETAPSTRTGASLPSPSADAERTAQAELAGGSR